MEFVACIEYAAFLSVSIAVWLIGRFDIRGQYIMVFGHVLWITGAYMRGLTPLGIQSVWLLILTINAIRNWTAEKHKYINIEKGRRVYLK